MVMATPATDLIALLERYNSLHTAASSVLRASFWDLAKARRGQAYQSSVAGGIGFSADDLREELRPRALLEWNDGRVKGVGHGRADPDLVEDCDDGDGSRGAAGAGGFVLHLDGMDGSLRRRLATSDDASAEVSKEGGGLRRRRGKANDSNSNDDGKWIGEDHATAFEEEGRLRRADPLELFGVPPPALREAQAKNRSAVAYYVEVANLAREMMVLMSREAGVERRG